MPWITSCLRSGAAIVSSSPVRWPCCCARLAADPPPAWVSSLRPVAGKTLPWMVVAGSLGAALLLLRRAGRFPARVPPVDPVLESYAALLRLLARRGLRRAPPQTTREFARRANAVVDRPEIESLTALLETSVFGANGSTPDAVAAAKRMTGLLQDARRFDRAAGQGHTSPGERSADW